MTYVILICISIYEADIDISNIFYLDRWILMRITTFAQIKGGTGKSTIACNMAVCNAWDEKTVLLINADRNQNTAKIFIELRDAAMPTIDCVNIAGDLREQISQFQDKYDEIIIDTGGYDGMEARSALLLSNMVIIPVMPNNVELAATMDAKKGIDHILGEAKSCNSNLKAILLFNKTSTHFLSSDVDAAREYVEAQSKHFDHITETSLKNRVAYDNAFGLGLGVAEYSDEKASFEMIKLYREIF